MAANGVTGKLEADPWMTTGDAARALGYLSREGFIRKFTHVITCIRTAGGHYRWDRVEVMKLRDQSIIF